MEILGEAWGAVTAVGGVVAGIGGAWYWAKKVRREVMEFAEAFKAFVDKYGDANEDAKALYEEFKDVTEAIQGK